MQDKRYQLSIQHQDNAFHRELRIDACVDKQERVSRVAAVAFQTVLSVPFGTTSPPSDNCVAAMPAHNTLAILAYCL
ncbi:unnamed protein product [Protopolystoma xenopodis]|uniref:Uncharacterized protein n=1 Tax=Protopolystoma xenopodis TaxID=117903 RepID=A0A3S5AIM3_9PLAT|nr:unnamed protein product [Protopolystoma xenopodis]